MPWVYLDDGFPEHPKVLEAGGDAAWLFVSGLCYCNRNLTFGHISKSAVARLTDRRRWRELAAKLVSCGLWEDRGDRFYVHDYDEWNKSAIEYGQKADQRRQKAKLAAQARWAKAAAPESADATGIGSSRHRVGGEQANGDARSIAPSKPASNAPEHATSTGPSIPPRAPARGTQSPIPPIACTTTRAGRPAEPSDGEAQALDAKDPAGWWADRSTADRVALVNLAQKLGWVTPRQRGDLTAVWDWASFVDRRAREDVIVECADSAVVGHPNYLRRSLERFAAEHGIAVPEPMPTTPGLAAALQAVAAPVADDEPW